MYARSFRRADQTRRFTIAPVEAGWEVREECDSRIVRRVHYTDWHRVERAREAFAKEAATLQDSGWTETA